MCQDKTGWWACRTNGERKQSYAEYKTQAGKRDIERRRNEDLKKRDNFVSMLKEIHQIQEGGDFNHWEKALRRDERSVKAGQGGGTFSFFFCAR